MAKNWGYSFSFGVFMQHRSLQNNKEIKSQKLLAGYGF
jgi:hypothetical protein